MIIKIAISGKFCSGKTTLSNQIISLITSKYRNMKIKKLSFASEVKRIATQTFLMKDKNRNLLQSIGRKMREIDEDVFCKYVINEVNNDNSENQLIILDDLRYENEMTYLKDNGFILIRLYIDPKEQIERIKSIYPDENYNLENFNHESEIGLDNTPSDNFDLYLNGNKNNTEIIKEYININYK